VKSEEEEKTPMTNDSERAAMIDLLGGLVSSNLGMGLAGIENFARCYEVNGKPAVATWARDLAQELRQRHRHFHGRQIVTEPEVIIAAVKRDISRAHFWWNDRIYCIKQVRRFYVDPPN
jgi:hypothetical protein